MASIAGLMCIPPADEPPAPHFALTAKIARRNGLTLLSMGMSADFPLAIAFGATHVRVGTAIFGTGPDTLPADAYWLSMVIRVSLPAPRAGAAVAAPAPRSRRSANGRPGHMDEHRAAPPGHPRPRVVVDFDDEVIEMVVPPQPVAGFIGRRRNGRL